VPPSAEILRRGSSHLPYFVAAHTSVAGKVGSALAGAIAPEVVVAVVEGIHIPGRSPVEADRVPDSQDMTARRRLDRPGLALARRIAAVVVVALAADGSHNILLLRPQQERTRPRCSRPRKWLPLRRREGRRRRGCEISSFSGVLYVAKGLFFLNQKIIGTTASGSLVRPRMSRFCS